MIAADVRPCIAMNGADELIIFTKIL